MKTRAMFALLLCAACGSDGGEGSRTLFVSAEVEYKQDRALTKVDIEVRRGSADGPAVNGASVLITGDKFRFAPRDDGKGKYKGEIAVFEPDLRLEVSAGPDSLEAFLEGPDRFALDPRDGSAVNVRGDAAVPLVWDPELGRAADRVEIRVLQNDNDVVATLVEDAGEFEVPARFFRLDEHRVRVARSRTLDLEGGVPGSVFTIRYVVENRVLVTR